MKTPTPEQIQAALTALRKIDYSAPSGCPEDLGDDIGFDLEQLDQTINENWHSILFALRFTAKMMEEPSEGMITEGQYAYQEAGEKGGDYAASDTAQFKAMRDQAIKEICKENTENFTDKDQPVNKMEKTLKDMQSENVRLKKQVQELEDRIQNILWSK